MTHCHDFFRKWKREGNFCGLRKQDAREMDSYLTLVERISNEKTGLNSDLVFDKFTAGAARPIIRCKDPETETKALNYVIACLKRGEDVTGGDLQATVNGFMGKEPKPPAQMRQENPSVPMESTQMRTQEQSDAAPVTNTAPYPSLAEQMKSEPYGTQHVHPGPAAINPVIINDTHRESPFKTGLQVRAGIAGEMYPAGNPSAIPNSSPPSPDEQRKATRQRRIDLADQLIEILPPDTPGMVRDILREHSGWNAADVFYMGVQVLHERKGRV